MNKVYACIDLKSFYASVECVTRKLNPLNTNLVVADKSRTEKTICLAVSPSLKQYGIPGRARLFEIMQKVKEINYNRAKNNYNRKFSGKSYIDSELKKDKTKELDFIIAPPRMKTYMNYSTKIYNIYLKYISQEDIYVYSIDEVFMDITNYLKYYKLSPKQLITKIIKDVYKTTGITATAGIGTNLFIAKVAMDVVAKHALPNEFGVRIASLDERSYREKIWPHRPITDIWRIGRGLAKRLEKYNIYTMGDIARFSLNNEDILYKEFGVNAELIIDHAWGYEPVTMKDIREYKPLNSCMTQGQVLHCPYKYEDARLVVSEMADLLALSLVDKKLITDKIVLDIGYDIENISNDKINYNGEIKIDRYGRTIPKESHGTINLDKKTSSSQLIMKAIDKLFNKIVNKQLLIKRINIAVLNLIDEKENNQIEIEQFDLFTNIDEQIKNKEKEIELEKKDKEIQKVVLDIKNKYGKNSILKGMNLKEKATTIDRNRQVGGHHE